MSLYADLNSEASKLANLKGVFRSLKEADSILAHINEDNRDFWIEKPKQMIFVLTSYETILKQKETEVFYIDVDDEEEEVIS